jgi:hypothetical protein
VVIWKILPEPLARQLTKACTPVNCKGLAARAAKDPARATVKVPLVIAVDVGTVEGQAAAVVQVLQVVVTAVVVVLEGFPLASAFRSRYTLAFLILLSQPYREIQAMMSLKYSICHAFLHQFLIIDWL